MFKGLFWSVLFIALFINTPAHAQSGVSGTISGRVVNESGQAISRATIIVLDFVTGSFVSSASNLESATDINVTSGDVENVDLILEKPNRVKKMEIKIKMGIKTSESVSPFSAVPARYINLFNLGNGWDNITGLHSSGDAHKFILPDVRDN